MLSVLSVHIVWELRGGDKIVILKKKHVVNFQPKEIEIEAKEIACRAKEIEIEAKEIASRAKQSSIDHRPAKIKPKEILGC